MAIDKNKIIEAATKYVQKGQYDKAIKEYNKLLDADPRDARIQQKLGELYQKKGENGLAADCFLKVAESYSADGFFLKAVAVYKQVLKLNPKLIDVNLKLAELHQQLGLMSDAMAQYQLVVEHYDKVGDARASLDTLRKMVDLDPDSIASRIKLAELYAREAMNPEAIAEFQHAAEYLKRNNRVDDYIKVAERLVFLDPGNIDLTRELAAIYLAKQDTKRALAKLQLCFKADPKDVETLHMLAQAFKELGQVSKTVSVYKELARIYDEQDNIEEERDVWRKISELAPDDPHARARLAPAQPAQAPAPAAAPAAAPGARGASAPLSAGAHEQISKLLTETDVYVKYGLHEKAIEHLKKVFVIDPNSVDAHEKAVTLYTATGNRAAALESLVTAIRLSIGKNDLDRARENLQTLCEKDPTHAEIPGFLEVVGGLAPIEEVAEIEEDAILVEAADEEIEVASEPPQVDLSFDGDGVIVEADGDDDSFILAAPNDDDAALEAAAQALGEDEVIAEAVDEDELIAEPPPDDDLAISVAAEQNDELVEAADDFEDFVEPPPDAPFDGQPIADAADAQYDQPFDPEGVGYQAFEGDEDFDSHEEATRVAYLPAVLAAQGEAAASLSAGPPAEWPHEEGNEEVTAVLPTLDPHSAPAESLAEPVADEFSELTEVPADFVYEPQEDEFAEPVADEFGAAAAEGPVADEFAEPVVEEPVVDEFAEPAVEEPVVDEFAEPAVEEPVVDDFAEPVAEEPAADESAEAVSEDFAEPVVEEPIADDFAEPVADDFAETEAQTSVVSLEWLYAAPADGAPAADAADEPADGVGTKLPPEEFAAQPEPPADEPVAPEDQEAAADPAEPAQEAAQESSGPEADGAASEEGEEEPAGDELDEAAFFVEQGELEEARDILETVLIAFPNSKRAQELMARLEAKERGEEEPAPESAAAAPEPAPAAEASLPDIAFDLANELAKEDFGDFGDESVSEDFQYSVEDVFNEFKKGVKKIVRPEDVDTHYDLGIAYKEMGLIDDAIGEFEQALSAAAGKKKEVECYTMIGLCRAEREEHAAAVEAFVKGVKSAAITPDAAKALHYEIGTTLEKMGELRRALKHLSAVEKVDSSYREVKSVLARLRAQVSAEPDPSETTDPGVRPKNGVSSSATASPAPLGRQTTAKPAPLGRQATGNPAPTGRQATAKPASPDRRMNTNKPPAAASGEKADGKPAPAKKSRNIGYV
ncbi:MAG: tetratricopeptide repeat protein [Myxococcales bacterium]